MNLQGLKSWWMASLVVLGCGRAAEGVAGPPPSSTPQAGLVAVVTDALRKALRQSEAERGFVILSDAKTGERLAAVALRAATATEPEKMEPIPALIDPASLSKPLIAVAALVEGVTTVDEVHDCGPGAGGYDNFDRLTVGQMVIHSSNRCAERIAVRLSHPTRWNEDCVDPQALIDAYGAFAKEEAVGANRQVRQMLAQVVTEGTGTRARSATYSTAGKTGSAEGAATCALGVKAASFLGFAPVDRPAIVVFAAINNPKVGPAIGGRHAAPLFREVVERALPLLGVPGDRPTP